MTANTDQPPDVWIYDSAPTEPGWYPVVLCWDGEEGQWPGTAKWTLDGKWEPDRPVMAHGPHFEKQSDADVWAYQHDDALG